MARPEIKYPCFGRELTAKQAAKMLFVTPQAVRNRLAALGGDMEAVMRYYMERYGLEFDLNGEEEVSLLRL